MRFVSDDVLTYIEGSFPKNLLDPVTSYFAEGAWYAKSYRQNAWDGRIRYVRWDRARRQWYFPTGFLPRVTRYLQDEGYPYSLDDQRQIEPITDICYTLRDRKQGTLRLDQGKYSYQGEALDAFLEAGRGILALATGGGKSECGAAAIRSINRPTVWFTHLRVLLYQTRERLAERLGQRIGIIGDGECEYEDVTVAMIQSCAKNDHSEFLKTREFFIGDEIHHLESKQWYDVILKCPAPWRLGLSATPTLDGDGFNLLALTGPILYTISSEELVQRGVLVPPRIWFVPVDGPRLPKSMDHKDVYQQGIVENEDRTAKTVEVCRQLAAEKKSTLVLVKRIPHGERLVERMVAAGMNVASVRGSTSHAKRDAAFADLRAGKIDAVVATASIVGEGADFPFLRAIVNATGGSCGGNSEEGASGRGTIQFLGRGLRASTGKPYVDYVDFSDTCHKHLAKLSLDRLCTLKDEGYGARIKLWDRYAADGV
jgi:superfamily II DNA or RNA helicase